MKEYTKIIVKNIKANIVRRLGAEVCALADEEINALAYACTFRAPRPFKEITMDSAMWNELANTLTGIELMNVHEGLKRFRPGGNRLFYILGCFARVYGGRDSATSRRKSDHKERRYTNAELARIVRPLEETFRDFGIFTDADL